MSKFRNKAKDEPAAEAVDTDAKHADAGFDTAANDTAANDPAASPEERGDESTIADPLENALAERDQFQNQLQRTLADLQNFRKRRVQEMADARRAAVEALVGELLPVLDNFHLAAEYSAPEGAAPTGDDAAQSMRQGILMVQSLLEAAFGRHGVVEIEAAGTKFDPAVHEAVGIDPDPAAEEGIVTKVLQKGYTIDGRILRPTRVMVGGAAQDFTTGGAATEKREG